MSDFHLHPFDEEEPEENERLKLTIRVAVASLIVLIALIAECIVMVPAD